MFPNLSNDDLYGGKDNMLEDIAVAATSSVENVDSKFGVHLFKRVEVDPATGAEDEQYH